MKKFFFLLAASFILFGFISTPTFAVHRFHTSLTRMDYNADEKSVEITIQLFTHDLKEALEQREKIQINFEKTPKIDEIILKYLSDRFVLKNKNGEVKKLKWIGMEVETDSIWLYVETQMPETMTGATLENRVFQEIFADQANLVTCRHDGKKIDLVFKSGQEAQELTGKSI